MIQDIQKLIAADLRELDKAIIADLSSGVPLIRQVSQHIINSGGKRIRPLITILCAHVCQHYANQQQSANPSQSHPQLLYKMAAMIEYIHTATLLHDDVVDDSTLRRGKQTANALFGNAASVLVGDFIYTRAFQLMVEANSLPLLKLMADSTNKISTGEVLQLLNIGRSDLCLQDYLNVIDCKTATLFRASAKVATIITHSDDKFGDLLAEYAYSLGMAFQIVDDLLDYVGDSVTMGKNLGDDLAEGKITLPLIYTLKQANVHDKELIKLAITQAATQTVAKPSAQTSTQSHGKESGNLNGYSNYLNQAKPTDSQQEQLLAVALRLIHEHKAVPYCLNIAHDYIHRARQNLSKLPPSIYKDALDKLALFSLERIH